MRILLTEDDPQLGRATQMGLEQAGYAVDWVQSAESAHTAVRLHRYGCLLLDLALPGEDGMHALATLRRGGYDGAILIVTARDQIVDRVAGLDAGADDFIVKPFDLDELEARVRALVRRSADATDSPGNLPARSAGWCGMQIDRDSGAVYHDGEPLELAPRELALLRAVLSQPGQAITKERLFELVFPGEAHVQPEAIEVVAYRLRKKIGHTGAQLVTLRGLGYLLKAAA